MQKSISCLGLFAGFYRALVDSKTVLALYELSQAHWELFPVIKLFFTCLDFGNNLLTLVLVCEIEVRIRRKNNN